MSRCESYILCTSPRSGSTLLCRLLAATGKSGIPDSHFHSPSISEWARLYNIAMDNAKSEYDLVSEIFQAARRRGTGNTGMFGLRLQRQSFDFFIQKLNLIAQGCLHDHDRFQKVFGLTRYVHLTRKNKLEQAISFVRATQSGLWHKAPDGTELERLSEPQDPAYDAKAIEQQILRLTAMDEQWNTWFADQLIDPMRITYENLANDPIKVTGEILEYLGLSRKLSIGLELPVAKLADETSRNWASRFQSSIK